LIKPKPKTYKCTSCNWQKTVAPSSDALVPGFDHYEECPKCGNENLETRAASSIDVALDQFKNIFK